MNQDQDVPIEDLRDFLVKKIKQSQGRSIPNQIEKRERDLHLDPDPDVGFKNFSFKASTLTHIAELKSIGC